MDKDSFDLNEVANYFKTKLVENGDSAEGMDWKNKETQYLRFDRILKFIDLESSPQILDVGCGTGALYEYIKKQDFQLEYFGIDITEKMIDFLKQKFGEGKGEVSNLEDFSGDVKYNWVVASGTYNAKLNVGEEEWETYFFRNLKLMFDKCENGIIFNCMSPYVDWTYDRLYYPDMNKLTKFIVENLSRDFVVDHAYDLYEMTICVWKK